MNNKKTIESNTLVGQRFGKLIVTERAKHPQSEPYMCFCKCDCGKEIKVFENALRRGGHVSCGCDKTK